MPTFTARRPSTLAAPAAPAAPAAHKPRNPLVAPALMRQAGRHASAKPRQAARRALKQQLTELDSP